MGRRQNRVHPGVTIIRRVARSGLASYYLRWRDPESAKRREEVLPGPPLCSTERERRERAIILAERIQDQQQAIYGGTLDRRRPETIAAAVDAWISTLAADHRATTVAAYRGSLAHLTRWAERSKARGLDALTRAHLAELRAAG